MQMFSILGQDLAITSLANLTSYMSGGLSKSHLILEMALAGLTFCWVVLSSPNKVLHSQSFKGLQIVICCFDTTGALVLVICIHMFVHLHHVTQNLSVICTKNAQWIKMDSVKLLVQDALEWGIGAEVQSSDSEVDTTSDDELAVMYEMYGSNWHVLLWLAESTLLQVCLVIASFLMLHGARSLAEDDQSAVLDPVAEKGNFFHHMMVPTAHMGTVGTLASKREKEKFTISENPEKFGLEAMIELSEYQKAVKEAGKYMVLPYLIPTPDVGGTVKRFMEVLQKKQVFLAELADIKATCEDCETALH
ncbi:hypothetical protein EDC04DRAFT_2607631 [Pisolithus marmoratus]|nr:hypothetical protein EDC04DRAFT_2607631 [Pisolithus marmoratus]